MTDQKLVGYLRRITLFDWLSETQLAAVAATAESITSPAGSVIAAQDAPATGAILVLDGEVEEATGTTRPTAVPPGTLLSEVAMVVDTAHRATIRSRSQAQIAILWRDTLLELMTQDQSIATALLTAFVSRLKGIAAELAEIEALTNGGDASAGSTNDKSADRTVA
mgnify:CR=1 FL=1